MLHEHGVDTVRPARMFVTQPRRIAVKSLYNRIHDQMKSKRKKSKKSVKGCDIAAEVGYRMGGGKRSSEKSFPNICYSTTGYLVLWLTHHADRLNNHTHLVIDEVHERTMDKRNTSIKETVQKHQHNRTS